MDTATFQKITEDRPGNEVGNSPVMSMLSLFFARFKIVSIEYFNVQAIYFDFSV